MSINLPKIDIDPDKINTLEEAREVIREFLNIVEEQTSIITQLAAEVQKLSLELGKKNKQSTPPQFPKQKDTINYSATVQANKLGKEKKSWQKSTKKDKIPIDEEVRLNEVSLCDCGSNRFQTIRTFKKIVQGILIRRNNICYSGRDKQCADCGKRYLAEIPSDVKGLEFSSELRSFVSLWKFDLRMSEGLIHNFLTEIGIQISVGQISRIILGNSRKLKQAYVHLRVWGIKASRYFHTDSTGFKRLLANGTIIHQHMQVLCHKLLSLFQITRKYNGETVSEMITKRGRRQILISDDGSPNGNNLLMLLKQLCWLHEIRHYLKLTPQFSVHKKVLNMVITALWKIYFLAKEYGEKPTIPKHKAIEVLFDKLVVQKTGYGQLDKRLSLTGRKRERLLLFLDHPGIPIENNQAERDLRSAVIIRKISGATKSKEGDRSIQRHLSIIQTARKQGLNVFQTLHGLLTGQLSPFVLTAKQLA